eukprot:14050567-Alexandrium_andersonii.AAC.1
MQQRDALIRHLQDELAVERLRSVSAANTSRAANEHLERLAREDAARAQAEHNRVAREAMNEITALRAQVPVSYTHLRAHETSAHL